MYLYKFRIVFVQILNFILARDGGGHLQSEVSNLGCTRVTISICQNFEKYLSKFEIYLCKFRNVFVQILKLYFGWREEGASSERSQQFGMHPSHNKHLSKF